MGHFARFLRQRPGRGGGVNIVNDKVQKRKFQKEIEELVDPDRRAEAGLHMHEEMVLKSHREPTPKEVLTDLARQCEIMRAKRPGVPLDVYVGAYAFALLAQVRSYPEHQLGLKIILDKHIPPWDQVVMFRDGKGKKHGGIL